MSGKRICVSVLMGASVLAAYLADTPPKPRLDGQAAAPVNRKPGDVEIEMKNVNFRIAQDIEFEVRALRGRLRRTNPEHPVTFDDVESFLVEIDSGEVAITAESLSGLLNSYVFAYPGAPVKNIRATIEGSRVIQKGTIHKGIDIPFEIEGPVSATADGQIAFHAQKIKSAHVPLKGLLHLLGADLSKLMKENTEKGVRVEGDDILLNESRATPPPHLEGRVARAFADRGRIIQVFDSGRRPAALHPPYASQAYIYHRGGLLRFGKLTMEDADIEIVGDRKSPPFNFFLKEYKKQLVAGYSKNTGANGLVVHMADYSKFGRN